MCLLPPLALSLSLSIPETRAASSPPPPRQVSNYRSEQDLDTFCKKHGVIGICAQALPPATAPTPASFLLYSPTTLLPPAKSHRRFAPAAPSPPRSQPRWTPAR